MDGSAYRTDVWRIAVSPRTLSHNDQEVPGVRRNQTTISLVIGLVLVASACATSEDAADTDVTEATVTTTTVIEQTADDDAATHDEDAEHDEDAATHDDVAEHDEDAATHDEGAFDRVVPIVMTDLAFAPERLGVVAGETIRFEVRNDGALVLEFRLSNGHRIEEHLASGHADHQDDGGHHEEMDVVLELDPGESGEIDVTFPEDATMFTEIACLIPGHYEGGMKAQLIYA